MFNSYAERLTHKVHTSCPSLWSQLQPQSSTTPTPATPTTTPTPATTTTPTAPLRHRITNPAFFPHPDFLRLATDGQYFSPWIALYARWTPLGDAAREIAAGIAEIAAYRDALLAIPSGSTASLPDPPQSLIRPVSDTGAGAGAGADGAGGSGTPGRRMSVGRAGGQTPVSPTVRSAPAPIPTSLFADESPVGTPMDHPLAAPSHSLLAHPLAAPVLSTHPSLSASDDPPVNVVSHGSVNACADVSGGTLGSRSNSAGGSAGVADGDKDKKPSLFDDESPLASPTASATPPTAVFDDVVAVGVGGGGGDDDGAATTATTATTAATVATADIEGATAELLLDVESDDLFVNASTTANAGAVLTNLPAAADVVGTAGELPVPVSTTDTAVDVNTAAMSSDAPSNEPTITYTSANTSADTPSTAAPATAPPTDVDSSELSNESESMLSEENLQPGGAIGNNSPKPATTTHAPPIGSGGDGDGGGGDGETVADIVNDANTE